MDLVQFLDVEVDHPRSSSLPLTSLEHLVPRGCTLRAGTPVLAFLVAAFMARRPRHSRYQLVLHLTEVLKKNR